MHNFVIITDTASDMTRDLRERFGVEDYSGRPLRIIRSGLGQYNA